MSERDPGQPIVSQWEATFDFYVILEGRVQVFVDDLAIDVLGLGEFLFGELAAIDWGSGFGYPRTGSVVALERTTMLSFTAGTMNELTDQPAIGRQIPPACGGATRAGPAPA